jgi:predicted  nucleic acid-binding Zn-ribbon protein
MLESIDQELPEDIKTSLEPISDLDIHYVAIRRALKSQSSRLVVEQKKARDEQTVKGSQAQIESNKEMLTNLQSALELKIARKTALETELRNLSAEIEADEKKIVELPGLIQKTQEEASASMIEANQHPSNVFGSGWGGRTMKYQTIAIWREFLLKTNCFSHLATRIPSCCTRGFPA